MNAVTQSLEGTNYEIDTAESILTIISDIQEYNSQIVIINWTNADFPIDPLCKKIRKIKHTKYLYIIIIADRSDQKKLLSVIDAGANDVLFRPFGKEELQLRLQTARNSIKLEESVRKFRKEMLKFAKEDPHTNLLNRRALLDEVLKEMMRASRETKFISAIIVSLSNFKELADLHGSESGDAILLECSRKLKSTCRPYDKIGRIGIAEFLIILPDSGLENARKVSERILSSLTKKPLSLNNQKINLSCSLGVSELNPTDVSKNEFADNHLMNDLILDSLIRRAELALQKAREQGKNTIQHYNFS
jgi:two-component system cell cycle response regulator